MSPSVSHLSLWETAKNELRNVLPRADFETWISSLQPLTIQDGKVLVLEAPSVLTEAWVNSNYAEMLRRQLTLVAGRNMDYRLTASVDAAREVAPAPASVARASRQAASSPAPGLPSHWSPSRSATTGCGSDPARSIRTTAKRQGDYYVLNGSKMWITGAGGADWGLVFARTGDSAQRSGISCFIVDGQSLGLTCRPIKVIRSYAPYEVTLQDVKVPVENRLGEEGQGFKQLMRT
ncbi:MAG: hypothetical protein RI910_785, partial [Verrucomicrobiota bacterium]